MPGCPLSPRDVMEAEDRAVYYLRKLVWRSLSGRGRRSAAGGPSRRERSARIDTRFQVMSWSEPLKSQARPFLTVPDDCFIRS